MQKVLTGYSFESSKDKLVTIIDINRDSCPYLPIYVPFTIYNLEDKAADFYLTRLNKFDKNILFENWDGVVKFDSK